jgi:formylglycine-generating enzyme required for sulfatase activity
MPDLLVKRRGLERLFGRDAFPLALGGAESEVALPGWGRREPAAFLGQEAGGHFVQPGPLPFPLLRNGAALVGPAALAHGDRLQVGRAELVYYRPPGESRALLVVTGDPVEAESAGPASAVIAPIPLAPAAPAPRARRPRRGWGVGLGLLVLLLLAAAAAWMLAARTVRLVFDPPAETVAVRGRWPGLTLGASRLLLSGPYTVEATRQGYHPFQAEFTVDRTDPQTHAFTLRKLPGRVSVRAVSAEPRAGAVQGGGVKIGAQGVGPLPVALASIEPGPHVIEVAAPDFLPARTNLVVTGLDQAQTVEFTLIPDWSWVEITSEPPGAAVTLNDETRGATPLRTRVRQGEHVLGLTLPLHVGQSTQIVVQAHTPLTLPVLRLPLSPGRLRVISDPPGANLTSSFLYAGATPAEFEATARVDHELHLDKPGYEPETLVMRVEPEQVAERRVALREVLGEVRFDISPPDAEIRVEGRPLPAGARTARLRTVPQAVEVSREGFQPVRRTVTPRPGLEIVVSIALAPVAAPTPTPTPSAPAAPPSAAGVLVPVQPRDFALGSPRNEQGRRSNENLRPVRMSRPFRMAAKEVTNGEFRRFLAGHSSGEHQGQSLNADDQPVVRVTWPQAAAYCNWLSAQEGLPPAYVEQGGKLVPAVPMTHGYRLPTEAEWEFCARGQEGKPVRRYPWGMAMPPPANSGNYADLSARAVLAQVLEGYTDGFAVSAPPGRFPANELGLFDLGGNVAEWVHDTYDIPPPEPGEPAQDPLGPPPGPLQVIKGASWMHASLSRLRAAYRDYSDEPRADVGFRVARYEAP